ncbi:hypothetical protein Dsin_005104 [Dipteronia sinensis]|uniref:Uncharacterized protein n=1 Tax=Dipteronia sinensis TaxID=43782 RepID=A0AAE0AW93_9ROSI|nr:hypothetical protein Dsin_005104 [Dipteronia sinensis]
MLTTFLLIIDHNNRYCLVRDTFGRSHFTTSINFNKVLKALNTKALDMMAKPGSLSYKIREITSGWEGSTLDSKVDGRRYAIALNMWMDACNNGNNENQ